MLVASIVLMRYALGRLKKFDHYVDPRVINFRQIPMHANL